MKTCYLLFILNRTVIILFKKSFSCRLHLIRQTIDCHYRQYTQQDKMHFNDDYMFNRRKSYLNSFIAYENRKKKILDLKTANEKHIFQFFN